MEENTQPINNTLVQKKLDYAVPIQDTLLISHSNRRFSEDPVKLYAMLFCLLSTPFVYVMLDILKLPQVLIMSILFVINGGIGLQWIRSYSHTDHYQQREKIYLESVGDGIFAVDKSYKIFLWNKAASQISGWLASEVIGKDFREIIKFVHESDKTPNITFIEEALLHGEVRHLEGKTVLITKNGTEVPVSDSAAPLFDAEGKVSGIIIVFQDITSQRENEKEKEEFSSFAAHQLRTPATAIKNYSAMLLDGMMGPITEDQKELIVEIKTANNLLINLINAMLNIARVEVGTLAIDPKPTELKSLIDEAIHQLATLIEQKKLRFDKKYDPSIPVINLDPNVMHAVIQNLLSNAIKYTPEGGFVSIEAEKQDTKVLIKVIDNGSGIPHYQQEKVFTKMFRADNVVQKEATGTGLGLYLVKKLVDEYGGEIHFESEENKGTIFFVTVPLVGMKKKAGIRGLS